MARISSEKGCAGTSRSTSTKNATGTDLWSAMQEETGQPVVAMMESWINQVGYPVLNVDVDRADAVSIGLTQQRFLYSGPNQDATLWQIPVKASVQGVAEPVSMVMSDREAALEAQPSQGVGDSWVKVNSQQTGFYRVQYKQEDLARLIPAVESLELPAADRLGLQADAYALARAGLAPATQFLDLARAYGEETEYPVWADLTANLRGMASLIAQEPYYEQYQEFGRGLLNGIAHKVGWEKGADEGHLQSPAAQHRPGAYGSIRRQPRRWKRRNNGSTATWKTRLRCRRTYGVRCTTWRHPEETATPTRP